MMQMLYDSDAFVVVAVNANHVEDGQPERPERNGFEVVDKRRNTSLYLDGRWADDFQAQIKRWQDKTPHQEEVEETLDGYSQLAHYPLVIH